MTDWDYHYKQLNKADPQLEEEDHVVYAVFGAIVMVVAVACTMGMIWVGAKLLGVV